MKVCQRRTAERDHRRSPSLLAASVFCYVVKRDCVGQLRHRDLLRTKIEAVELVLEVDGGDRKERYYRQ